MSEAPAAASRDKVVHLGEVHPDDVLIPVGEGKEKHTFVVNGVSYTLKITSVRLRVFQRSRACAICGLVGTKMMLDLPPDALTPHFNLYGEENGQLVLFTKDHVNPRSLGGKDEIENLRTACHSCNNVRGNDIWLSNEEILRRRAAGTPAKTIRRSDFVAPSPPTPLPFVSESVNEESVPAMAWALVRYAYAVTSALGLGDEPRAFDAAKKAQQLLGRLLGKLKSGSVDA